MLELEDNAIDDTNFMVNEQVYNNIAILASLNKNNTSISTESRGSLTELLLRGNSGIVNFEPLKSLNWTRRSGF